MTIAVETA